MFDLFDTVHLLADGYEVYFGPRANIESVFASAGAPDGQRTANQTPDSAHLLPEPQR